MHMSKFFSIIFPILFFCSAYASDMPCKISGENGFKNHLPKDMYTLEIDRSENEDHVYLLTVDGKLNGLPIQNIGLVRESKGSVVMGASLRLHAVGEKFRTYVVGIPEQDADEYKFYVSYSETERICPLTKGFYVSFSI